MMLLYHPAQDANHCVYRTLLILEHTVHKSISLELYRLLDFYVLFPHLLKHIKPLPSELRAYKRIFSEISEPFETMRNTKRIMYETEAIQTVAIHNLLAKHLLDMDSYKSNQLQRTTEPIPSELLMTIQSSELAQKEWFRVIVNELPAINFGGNNGLKKRSGLMEYRYDTEYQ